ncbi:MAG: hypothetical protein RL154_129 [Pseudomonadota bacterium]|jgi:DNA-binding MarR family transcriptional regulator
MFSDTENFAKSKFNLLKSDTDVLVALYFNNGILTPTELASITVFSSGGLTKVLKNLEKQKLITRKKSEEDKRSKLVFLEEIGSEIIQECLKEYCKIYDNIFSQLTENERTQLSQTLKSLSNQFLSE